MNQGLERLESAREGPVEPADTLQGLLDLGERVEDLEAAYKEVLLAVDEGIQRVDRAERRIKDTVKRARRKLAESGVEDDGLEAENVAFHDDDAGRSDEVGVQPLRTAVAETPADASSIRGVSADQLKRAWGSG